MKVFKNNYGDLRRKRSDIDGTNLSMVYKKVLSEYKKGIREGNYLLCFLVIQSLLEDRIYVLYRMMIIHKNREMGIQEVPELEKFFRGIDVKETIKELHKYGWISDKVKDRLFLTIDVRNKHIHFSFIGFDNFTEDLCNGFYQQFREVDSIIKKYKRVLEN